MMDKMLDIEDCHAREIEDGKPVCTNVDKPCPTPECKEVRKLNAEYIDELSASEEKGARTQECLDNFQGQCGELEVKIMKLEADLKASEEQEKKLREWIEKLSKGTFRVQAHIDAAELLRSLYPCKDRGEKAQNKRGDIFKCNNTGDEADCITCLDYNPLTPTELKPCVHISCEMTYPFHRCDSDCPDYKGDE